MDYRELYNQYWQRDDRRGEHSFKSVAAVADEIQNCLGIGSVLDVGCGNGHLVRRLNSLGWDASGLDVSDVAVEVANQASPGRFVVGEIRSLPFDDHAFDFVVSTDCFEHLEEQDVLPALAELRRVARDAVYLRIALAADRDKKWHLTIKNREWWETRCYEVGFRKHPRYLLASPFGSLDNDLNHCTIVLTKIPDEVTQRFPLEQLHAERQLHTDMSREAGRRSDAHNMRYFEAARSIRPGDRVIDIACGLGYGSTILTKNSRCASYLGIDNSQFAIDYAKASFERGEDDIRFQQGSLPECLAEFPTASFDFIASFETLEHLKENRRYLEECRRVLSPGGRLMISVPHDWTEEDGLDPNPHHFHVYDWNRLLPELEETGFAIEKAFAETVSRRKEQGAWTNRGYEWQEYPVEEVRDKPGEWCVALAMKSPFDTQGATYADTAFPETKGGPPTNVVDFAGQYQNPWLISSLVTRGLRTDRTRLRLELAQQAIERHATGPDQAAALCVTAYALLDSEAPWSDVEELIAASAPHVSHRDWHAAPPVDVRWGVSLRYVLALLSLHGGMRDLAKEHFEACAAFPFMHYSPLLGTKVVGATVQRATLAMADHDLPAVEKWLAKGIELAEQAVGHDWHESLGDLARQPLPALHELAEVVELAAQCAAGLSLLHTNKLDMVYFEQFRASKTLEVRRVNSEYTQMLEYLRIWQEASQFWQSQAERLQGRTDGPHGGPRGFKRHFERLGRSVSKRVDKLKGRMRGDS